MILGGGEVGKALYDYIKDMSTNNIVDVIDTNPDKMILEDFDAKEQTVFLHIAIPYTIDFMELIKPYTWSHQPKAVIIHSTVPPGTTKKIQELFPKTPWIIAPARGVHSRMVEDMKRYVKFWACEAKELSVDIVAAFGLLFPKSKRMSSCTTVELAKLVTDTSYYGWLIAYAQRSKIIADSWGVDYDEMWSYVDDAHKILGNRPKMYPGMIGGHCVLPNLDLLKDDVVSLIKAMDADFREYEAFKNDPDISIDTRTSQQRLEGDVKDA